MLNGEQPRGCLDAATRVHRGIPLKAHLRVEGIGILLLLLGDIFSLIYKIVVLNMAKP